VYSRVTMLLGMVPLDHEYKVMGLAPYAPEDGGRKSHAVLARYLGLAGDGLTFRRRVREPLNFVYPRLRRDLNGHRFDWIAWGVQRLTETLVRHFREGRRRDGLVLRRSHADRGRIRGAAERSKEAKVEPRRALGSPRSSALRSADKPFVLSLLGVPIDPCARHSLARADASDMTLPNSPPTLISSSTAALLRSRPMTFDQT